MYCQRTNAFSRKLSLAVCLLLCGSFASCGNVENETDLEESESEEATSSTVNYELDNKLLENEKNVAGNGYIIVNDETDYPEWIKDFRYDLSGTVVDFYGNEVFSVDEDDLFFSCGLSAHKFENGLYGYININGKTVIEPIFDEARPFSNGSALVSANSETYYIDKSGNECEDKTYDGYSGSLTEHDYYFVFTGSYLMYQDANDENFSTDYGYSDADGNDTPIPYADKAYTFMNGYAFIEATGDDGGYEYYFINENFERVTDFSDKDIISDPYKISNLLDEGYLLIGLEYVYEDGYFIYNTGAANDPEFMLIKIVPELYETSPKA